MAARVIRTVVIASAVIVLLELSLSLWITWMADAYLGLRVYLAGDFVTYWAGARHLLAGDALYSPTQLNGPFRLSDMDYGSGYVYPPTAAVLSVALAPLPVVVAWSVFVGVGVTLLALLVYKIGRSEGLGRSASLVIGAIIMTSGPVAQAAFAGNVNLLVAVGLAAIWLRPELTGWLAVAGGLIKLYPSVAVIWSVRAGRVPWFAAATGVLFLACVVAIFGIGQWKDFVASLANAQPFATSIPQPPRVSLQPVLGVTLAALAAYAGTLALAGASLFVRSDRIAFFLLSLAMIMPAQEWHIHYYLIPLIGGLPWATSALSAALNRQIAEPHDGGIRRRSILSIGRSGHDR
jgi:hypothetical protein